MIKLLSGSISSTDNLLTLVADKEFDSTIFGRVKLLPSKIEIVIQFTKRSATIYASRLRIDSDILQDIKTATITFEEVSANFSRTYPEESLPVDAESIKSCIITTKYKEVLELKLLVRELQETIKALTKGSVITAIDLKNKNSIAPGMVPVAIDEKGTFIGAYPFNDMIKSVNGITPISGELRLSADDIPLLTGMSLQEAWQSNIETTTKILSFITTIETQLSSINARIKDIETQLATHINTGII